MELQNQLKQMAAKAALEYVVEGEYLGVGTGTTALPRVRWHRQHQPGCTVFAGCGDSLPRMPRFPLCQGGRADFLHQQVRNQIFPAAADGYGCEHCPDRLCRLAGGAPAADCFTGTRPWLPDPWRGNARPFRRRGPAPEAGQRDGQSPVGLSVCL